ncbi:MAG: CDP-alcohol phosphatidyltransferase family protein [Acidimicrobiales bacterium]|nr:CDP-alcohol phosphatidyltransferase family protein [Acidimicrobiales bacterium]
MLDGNWRNVVDRGLSPIGKNLHKAGITADVVTVIGILMAVAASISVAVGSLRLGFVLLVMTGISDALDGPVAKASGAASLRGAFFDSVSDRLTDALLLGGIAWFLIGDEPGYTVMLPVSVMFVSLLISYQRAKAESLGLEAKGGLMERAERFIVLAIGLLFSEALIVILWVMLALSTFTALQRFVKVWKQASAVRETSHHQNSGQRRQLRLDRRKERRQRLAARRSSQLQG